MKIFFAVPAYRGIQSIPFLDSLEATLLLCKERGIDYELAILTGCCYIQIARNELVKKFRDSDADVLFFLDDDMSWKPEDALKFAVMSDEVIAGAYRYKTDREDYPIVINTHQDGRPIVRQDGCISAAFVPTGFLCIKRSAIERLCASYNSQRYYKRKDGVIHDDYFDLFPQGLHNGQWVGEDYAFCRLWTEIGGLIWVVPDLELTHHSDKKAFKGNYHLYLSRQPGGANAADTGISKALEIEGWMSLEELEWLAQQARAHSRIVEVGSWVGRSTRALADNTSGTVYAIDTWNGSEEHAEIMKDKHPDEVYQQFLANVADLPQVVPIRKPSLEAADEMRSEKFDMVFLDGDHSYQAVKQDIEAWQKRLASGGLLCGHDLDWLGVKQAVNEMLPGFKTVQDTTLWYCEV